MLENRPWGNFGTESDGDTVHLARGALHIKILERDPDVLYWRGEEGSGRGPLAKTIELYYSSNSRAQKQFGSP